MAGMSIRTAESIAKLTKYSVTQVSLSASRLNVGSMQFVTTGTLYCSTGTSGLGGIVVGESLTAGTLYYVYAVVSSGQVYLVASTLSTLPTGFNQARVVGGFTTNASSQVDAVGEYPGNLSVAGMGSFGVGLTTPPSQNLLINGNFDFWQRGAGPLVCPLGTPVGTCDRWHLYTAASSDSVSKVTDDDGFSFFARITGVGTNVWLNFTQVFESLNSYPLRGRYVTFR